MKHNYEKIMKNVLFLCFTLISMGLYAQGNTVTGTVINEDGIPLAGVNIVQKGTSNGAVVDFDGNYKLKLVSGSQTLVFSYLGFSTKEVLVAGKSTINVTLIEDAQGLDEVVVVGYGTQKKSDITGSVSSVASKDLEKAQFNTVDQLLQGRASGVSVTSSSGEPGAPSNVRIRGNNSILGDNSPLYVVDGIPITGTPTFNPSDIESMEVLKDASATAIYGSRGANGVILVTTKRGKIGKTSISVNIDQTISNVISSIDMLNGQDYAEYRNEANVAGGQAPPFSNPSEYAGQGYNWQDEILSTGNKSNVGIDVQGGNDDMRFLISGNLLNDKGVVLESKYTRTSIRANIDADLFDDKLKLKFSSNINSSNGNNAISATLGFPNQLGPITNAILSEPLVPSRDYSGSTQEGFQFFNPYLEVTEKDDRSFNLNILSNLQATWQINDDFSFTTNGGMNIRNNLREIFYPSSVGAGITSNGTAQSNTGRAYDYVWSNYLAYSKMFNDAHDISAMVGVEYSEFNNYAFSTNVSNFDFQELGLDNVGIGTSRNDINSSRSLSVLQSGFLRVNYSFMDKYLVTFTGRADGSSKFATNNKWGYFPSAALGWKISNEDFLKDNETISSLKLRASYGETGSQALSPYQSIARYGFTVYPSGNEIKTGYIPTSIENPNLKWETTKQFNTGFDLGILKNKLSLTFDYFKKTTEDLLTVVTLPSQTGFGSSIQNFGTIENKGFELDLNWNVFNKKDFRWSTNFNYSSYKNTVIDLGTNEQYFGPGIASPFFGSGHIYKPGEEFGLFYGLKATGLIQASDASDPNLPKLNNDNTLGHWKFEDLDGSGTITGTDRQVIGNPNPDFLFGWNNDFSYKNLSLNIFVQGSVGNDIYNTLGTITRSGWQTDQSYKNQSVDWYNNRWTPQNAHNNIKYPSINNTAIPTSNFMVEDGSYLRLKNVSLNYTLPDDVLGLGQIQLFITGTNLITITNYTGFDPEVSSLGANSLAPGVDLGVYPRSSSVTLGLRATF